MNINLKLKYSYALKLIYGLVVIAYIIAAYFLINFLNTNFYKVITQAEDISILKQEVSTEIIDVALFGKILEQLNEKQKSLIFNIQDIKDIFGSSSKQSENF